MRVIVLVLAAFLCAGCTAPSGTPMATRTVTVTVTEAPPKAPDHFAVGWVYNEQSQPVTVYVRGMQVNSAGKLVPAFATTVLSAPTPYGGRASYERDSYPACDSTMQGVWMRVATSSVDDGTGGDVYQWAGLHCTGDTPRRGFAICGSEASFGEADVARAGSSCQTDGTHPTSGEAASVSLSSPSAGRIYITLVSGGAHAPYPTSDVAVSVDSHACAVVASAPAAGKAAIQDTSSSSTTGGAGYQKWDAGESMIVIDDCAGAPSALTSGSTHLVSVTVHGTVLQDNTQVVIK